MKYLINYSLATTLLLVLSSAAVAATVKGKVQDAQREPLIGANVVVLNSNKVAPVGLDGSYQLSDLQPGTYTLSVAYVGYQTLTKVVTISEQHENQTLNLTLEQTQNELSEVVVTAQALRGTETEARQLERLSSNTINVVSAKAIALSPDVSVANVVQRVSGLTVERNSNGDPQYAIVRGMDKRYSYTLVNGIKIPSPDNNNRYVPLDIFPAALLDRLEVYKSLTADREGDAIAGGVNMVMKSAPAYRELKADLQVGYNYINLQEGFNQFNTRVIKSESPKELYGAGYQAQVGDFTRKNLEVENVKPLPDVLGAISYGNRYFGNKLGLMLGSSFQNTYRGSKSIWFDAETERFGTNQPALRELQERHYSTQQIRFANHGRLDYRFSPKHSLNLYTGYYNLSNNEAREIKTTMMDGRNYNPAAGNAILSYSTRTRATHQYILNTTLQGEHQLLTPLLLDWSAVYSDAGSQRPDNARFSRNGELRDFVEQPTNVERRSPRQWERNADKDLSGYLNLQLKPANWNGSLVKAGGMYRSKERDNYFNRYRFDPNPGRQVQGEHWNTFSDVQWDLVNPAGSDNNELNYKATENILAYYALSQFNLSNLAINTGLRVEHTLQGYTLKTPKENQTPDSSQTYTDLLPSLSLKYRPNEVMNLRFNYYKAISRPGFFEVVPYVMEEDGYNEVGNANLKRVRSDNFDFRWEFFPTAVDQLLAGAFYKHIQDPIEYAVVREGVNNEPVIKPGNYGTATNLGLELDFCKYFNRIGLKGNYTYTYSRITTTKALRTRENPEDPTSQLTVINVEQNRPLQGQATHIGNLSLLYRDQQHGLDAQLAFVYTGERLETISPFLDNDMYARPITQVDLSVEKRISPKAEVFVKAMNLLNSPYEVYIKKPVYQEEGNTIAYPHQNKMNSQTLIRRDEYFQSVRVGVRVNF
ncbi:outer membrane beta-barrel protein [Pontibacter qinzhouensis]|uniref:Outer membrane beta-barrel protein n=1 Tax=Pontibacter qinzhouensis TaxID=2603253 RepID=A0A5C8K8H5_9BACT|nr:TonB-dependent receptor [Pontibacter qinzhouensis]TXK46805.1 outer membrane beta-barrel protein [Pontibacter qinzhouensis]